MGGEEEVRARHILVPTEDEAKAILADLKKGDDFAKLAKEKSKDPAPAANGGDLGYFTKDQMVPEFAEIAFKMPKGQLSDPVKTQFGWHIIKRRGQAHQGAAGVREGQGPDRDLRAAQGAGRVRHQAARGRQDRAARQAGEPARADAKPADAQAPASRDASWPGLSRPSRLSDAWPRREPGTYAMGRRWHANRDIRSVSWPHPFPSPRSPRPPFPTCRRSPASSSRPPPPASLRQTAPTCCWCCSIPAPRWPACSPSRSARRRRSNGAATSSRAASRARWWSTPATPMPSPARPAARPASSPREIASRAIGCKPDDVFLASTGVIGEPLNAKAFDGVMEGAGRDGQGRVLARRREGDHDHRHVPEGRDRQHQDRQDHRDRSTASPRAPA